MSDLYQRFLDGRMDENKKLLLLKRITLLKWYNVGDKRAGQTRGLAMLPESSTHFMTILDHNALNQSYV
jgi:hypothetical protein